MLFVVIIPYSLKQEFETHLSTSLWQHARETLRCVNCVIQQIAFLACGRKSDLWMEPCQKISYAWFRAGRLLRQARSASFPVYGVAGPWSTGPSDPAAAVHAPCQVHDAARLWSTCRPLQVRILEIGFPRQPPHAGSVFKLTLCVTNLRLSRR